MCEWTNAQTPELEVLAFSENKAPVDEGTTYGDISRAVSSRADGSIVLMATRLENADGRRAEHPHSIWRLSDQGTELLAREGQEAPGANGMLFIPYAMLTPPRDGAPVVAGYLREHGRNGLPSDWGIWRVGDDGLELALRSGEPLQGAPEVIPRRLGHAQIDDDGSLTVSMNTVPVEPVDPTLPNAAL